MPFPQRTPARLPRLLMSVASVGSLSILLLVDALRTLSHEPAFRELVTFGFAAFVAFMFLAVGTLVWFYARDRMTARLLYSMSCAGMIPFALETATAKGDQLAQAISSASSSLALLLFALLLLRFPQDMLSPVKRVSSALSRGTILMRLMMRGYIIIAVLLCPLAMLFAGLHAVMATPPVWLENILHLYNVIMFAGIVGTMVISYRSAPSVRERQQRRFFVWGVVLSLSPLLLLTVIPDVLQNVFPVTSVDGPLSAVSLVLLPLSLGYSVLRYQLLVFDTYVRRVVMWVIGVVCLALLVYVAQSTLGVLSIVRGTPLFSVVILSLLAVLSPCAWFLAKAGTERIFFDEVRHYRRFFKTPTTVGEHMLTLDEVARHLVTAARQAFETPDVCLFVLSEGDSTYQACPFSNNDTTEGGERSFMHEVASLLSPATAGREALDREHAPAIFARLASARRPLLLGELLQEEDQQGVRLTRYMNMGQQTGMDTLIAPIKAQGVIIGILVLGPRGDRHLYAGPDFEIVRALLGQFSPLLETARVTQTLRTTNAHLREANTQLSDAYEQQKELDRLKDQLIINVSHELRTPLSEVIGYLALLDENGGDLDPATQALFVKNAVHGCDELLDQVNTILNAALSSNGPRRTAAEVVPLARLVREEIDHLDPRIINAFHIDLQVADDIQVRTDVQALRQILRNLLSNALKYSPPHTTVIVSADVEARADQQTPSDSPVVRVCVKDEGPGIPPDELPLLFGKFVRLQRDLSGSVRGTGLGLYICKQMVEAMSGRIWVESTGIPGEGSRFHFTLPDGHTPGEQTETSSGAQAVLAR